MITVKAEKQSITLGKRGKNPTTLVVFDVSDLISEYGDGVAKLFVKRSKDVKSYEVPVTKTENEVYWNVTESDTFYSGIGECELQWIVGGEVVAKQEYKTMTYFSAVIPETSGKLQAEGVSLKSGVNLEEAIAVRPEVHIVDELPADAAEHENIMYMTPEEGDN